MKGKRLFILCFILLIVTACLTPSSMAFEDTNHQKIANKETNNSSKSVSSHRITCNWEGWKDSFPGVKCKRWPCERHIQVLRMKCMDGFISAVEAVRICKVCQESPGL
jgi:hypothetical protein